MSKCNALPEAVYACLIDSVRLAQPVIRRKAGFIGLIAAKGHVRVDRSDEEVDHCPRRRFGCVSRPTECPGAVLRCSSGHGIPRSEVSSRPQPSILGRCDGEGRVEVEFGEPKRKKPTANPALCASTLEPPPDALGPRLSRVLPTSLGLPYCNPIHHCNTQYYHRPIKSAVEDGQ